MQQPELWQDRPHYNSNGPFGSVDFTLVRAWRCMETLFDKLEIHPIGGGAPKRYSYEELGRKKFFEELCVYQGA